MQVVHRDPNKLHSAPLRSHHLWQHSACLHSFLLDPPIHPSLLTHRHHSFHDLVNNILPQHLTLALPHYLLQRRAQIAQHFELNYFLFVSEQHKGNSTKLRSVACPGKQAEQHMELRSDHESYLNITIACERLDLVLAQLS